MIIPEPPTTRKYKLLKFKPRQWRRKLDAIKCKSCRKQKVHWHWVKIFTMRDFDTILKEHYTAPIIEFLGMPASKLFGGSNGR